MDELSGFRLAVFGTVVILAGWASWWAKIKAMTVPRNAIVYQAIMASGVVLIVMGMSRGAGVPGGLLGMVGLLAGGMYLVTSFISGLPEEPLAVQIGERILDFEATDSAGEPFSLSSLDGRPFLLKFYRGHW